MIVQLALLGIDTCHLGVDAIHLGTDALALLGQGRVVAAYLVAGGLELAIEHLDLVIDVVKLLAWHGAILDELGKALALTLGVGDLLLDRRQLLVQVQLLTIGGRAVRRHLALAGG